MKVYCSKYALTNGITQHELVRDEKDGCAVVKWDGGLNGQNYLWRNDWHYNLKDAIARAEEIRLAKIASVKKQLAKLEKLDFTKEPKE